MHSHKTTKRSAPRLLWLFLLTGLCSAATATPGSAQVHLPTVNLGDTNFEDGFGAPGWFLEEFPSGYSAGKLKDSKGKTVPGSNRMTAYGTTTHMAYVSKKRALGAWLAGEALQPVAQHMGFCGPRPTPKRCRKKRS